MSADAVMMNARLAMIVCRAHAVNIYTQHNHFIYSTISGYIEKLSEELRI